MNAPMICVNTPVSYKCTCPPDNEGDGLRFGKSCIKRPSSLLLPLKSTLGLSLGLLSLLIVVTGLYLFIRRRRLIKMKENFFKKNGGLMLAKKLKSSGKGSDTSFKLFTVEALKKATMNFSEGRIVGRGGYGTVYKGTLPDNCVVAVKKSIIMDETQIDQFINEMVILTQIHHRNVVKLLGCCLETEVPILVYEFISKGSLSEHIHAANGESAWLTWNICLRIATEAANALGYLHSATSVPIIHRDVKTANILLDEKYTTKVSDFGGSRLIPLDQTQLSTVVQGTLGYMDPEYLFSTQLTEKSDVYSFGVVVAELMTRQKPLSAERGMGSSHLGTYFVASVNEGRVLEILDPQVVNEAPVEQLMSIAELVRKCLSMKGADRPKMKDVAIQLEALRRQTSEPQDSEEDESRNSQNEDDDVESIYGR